MLKGFGSPCLLKLWSNQRGTCEDLLYCDKWSKNKNVSLMDLLNYLWLNI